MAGESRAGALRRWLRLIVGAGVALIVVGVGTAPAFGQARAPGNLRVAVTSNILGDVVSNLVGPEAEVEVVMPVGANPHDFQASAREASLIRSADALVINGAGFEQGLDPVIRGAEADGVPTFAAISAVSRLDLGGSGRTDPHFFTDPARMAVAAQGIADFLIATVPALDTTGFRARVSRYVGRLTNLDTSIARLLERVPPRRRVLVTNHEVFGYFAQHYRMRVVGAVIPSGSTNDGASAGQLAHLARLIDKEQVPAIFADTSGPTKLADTLQAESCGDVRVVTLFSESLGPRGSAGATYLDMMGSNAQRITDALTRPSGGCTTSTATWLPTAFRPAFMQRALLGGLLAVLATSLVGTWVVMRGLAFLGDALAHGVIPGIALAVLWGFSPVIGALIAALVMSGLVTVVSSRTAIREDTGIGLLFVGMLSLGIIIVSRSRSFATDVTALLFGDVLGVTRGDIRGQAVAAVLVVTGTLALYRPFLALTFNRRKAFTLGMRPALAQAALLAMLAVSIVASFQAIGTLLVFGLLIGPPATASLFVHRVPAVMATSVLLGGISVVIGLTISFHHGTAGGATISGVAVGLFFLCLAGREAALLVGSRRSHSVPTPSS